MSDRAIGTTTSPSLAGSSARPRSHVRRHGWTQRDLLACLAAAAIGLAVTHEAWLDMVQKNGARAFGMPLLVLPAVAWLAWLRRGRLRIIPAPAPTLYGPLLMAVGWHVHKVVGAGSPTAQGLGAFLVTVGCVVSVCGVHIVRPFLPAFAALLFLVPLPTGLREWLFPTILSTTTELAGTLLGATGGDVSVGSHALSVSGAEVDVGTFAGGLNVVAGLCVVAYTFAFGTSLRRTTRIALLAVSPILILALNGLRVSFVAWLYGFLPDGSAYVSQVLSAWLCLPLAAALLWSVVILLRRTSLPVTRFNLARGL